MTSLQSRMRSVDESCDQINATSSALALVMNAPFLTIVAIVEDQEIR